MYSVNSNSLAMVVMNPPDFPLHSAMGSGETWFQHAKQNTLFVKSWFQHAKQNTLFVKSWLRPTTAPINNMQKQVAVQGCMSKTSWNTL